MLAMLLHRLISTVYLNRAYICILQIELIFVIGLVRDNRDAKLGRLRGSATLPRPHWSTADRLDVHSRSFPDAAHLFSRPCINSVDVVIHVQECPPHKRFFVGCSSPFMRLA